MQHCVSLLTRFNAFTGATTPSRKQKPRLAPWDHFPNSKTEGTKRRFREPGMATGFNHLNSFLPLMFTKMTNLSIKMDVPGVDTRELGHPL